MFTKWVIDIEGMEMYRFSENGELYRLPYNRGGKSYCLRKIKMQHPNRWLINQVMWSKNQLRPHLKLDPDPIRLTKTKDLPF